MLDIRKLVDEQASKQEVSGAVRQVMFYSTAYEPFAIAWQTGGAARWVYRFLPNSDLGFIISELQRMKDDGQQAQHLLIATKGGGAFFYGAPDDAAETETTVVGLMPNTCSPTKFAKSLANVAPGAPFTLLSDSGAGDSVVQGNTYKGILMMSEMVSVLGQPMLASDQVVVRNADGTATTIGNIYRATCAISSGIPQIFPLTRR